MHHRETAGFPGSHQPTCKLHRLLGPCFKTGREWHCLTKLRCTYSALRTIWRIPPRCRGHQRSDAATTPQRTPPWLGHSDWHIPRNAPGSAPFFKTFSWHRTRLRLEFAFWGCECEQQALCCQMGSLQSLRPWQAGCHRNAATIASTPEGIGSVASVGLAQGCLGRWSGHTTQAQRPQDRSRWHVLDGVQNQ